LRRRAARAGTQGDLRQQIADRDADLGRRRVQPGLGGQHIGPLPHQPGGHAHRQLARQRESGQLEARGRRIARKPTGQYGDEVALHGEVLLERRQASLGRGDQCLLRHHIGGCDGAEIELALQDDECFALGPEDLASRRDLRLSGEGSHAPQVRARGIKRIRDAHHGARPYNWRL